MSFALQTRHIGALQFASPPDVHPGRAGRPHNGKLLLLGWQNLLHPVESVIPAVCDAKSGNMGYRRLGCAGSRDKLVGGSFDSRGGGTDSSCAT